MSLNPSAKPFVFNPGASSFTPPAPAPAPAPAAAPVAAPATALAAAAPPAPPAPSAPAPVAASVPISAPVPISATVPAPMAVAGEQTGIRRAQQLAAENVENGLPQENDWENDVKEDADEENEEDEPIDESDPLWQAVLKIALGDRELAMKLLADPDSLMHYDEVRVLLEGGDIGNEEVLDDCKTEEISAALQNTSVSTPDLATAPAPVLDTDVAVEEKKQNVASPISGGDDEDEGVAPIQVREDDERENINLVFIGHVDAGKSTLSGNILYLTDNVDRRTIERYEREAKARSRESWFLAFIMDTSEEERAKGKTVEVGRANFSTAAKRYTILDAPGHKNYVPNMIAGAAQADVGVLVISARRGEFETGFERGGQTREHALLAKTLGVKYLVVVVNKMDDPTVRWAQERYDECCSKLKPFLKQCGYAIKKDVRFIAISGLNGANVKDEVSPQVCPWWRPMWQSGANNTTDATLLQCLDNLVMTNRDPAASLRLCVLDRYVERGTIAMGKVERGTLIVGDPLIIMPTHMETECVGIQVEDDWVRRARVGDNVKIKLSSVGTEDVLKGFVLCSPADPCRAVTEFTAQVALVDLLEHRPIFSVGYDCVLHTHTVETEVTVVKLVSVVDKKGEAKKARFAKTGQMCYCRMQVPQTICIDTYEALPVLGRFTLRDEGKTIAIGKIMELHQRP